MTASAGWITASAPGRAGIIGNPSDIYGGCVVSCTVAARNSCRVRLSDSSNWPEDPRLIKAAVQSLGWNQNFDCEWQTQIPRSSGLSGSTAALASALCAITALIGGSVNLHSQQDRLDWAEKVRWTERYCADIMCGFQDAHMIVQGGMNAMEFPGRFPFADSIDGVFEPVQIEPISTNLQFLMITTGVERVSGSVHRPLAQRWLSGDQSVVDAMASIGKLGQEGKTYLACSNVLALADAMKANHLLMQGLGATGAEVDKLVLDCLDQGAYAAKLAGAGHGGTVIALCDSPSDLEKRVRKLGYTRFLTLLPQAGLRLELATDPS